MVLDVKTWVLASSITIITLSLIYFGFRLHNVKKPTISNFIKLMVSNGDEVSSKRVIALIAFILMAISYGYGIMTDTKIPEYMWEGFLFIVLAAFFSNVVEKFKRKGDNDTY